jgi:glucan phosphoethanolaminetransferase (alkaline phosphatase superfamily)
MNNKKLLKIIGIYFITGIISFFILMLMHKPAVYFKGSYIDYLIFIYNKLTIPMFLAYILMFIMQWGTLMTLFIVSFKSKYIGNIILGIFSLFIGIELYYFYLQGGETSWNIGFNATMLDNALKIFNNPDLLNEAAGQYTKNNLFIKYIFIVPIIIFTIFFLIKRKLPEVKYAALSIPAIIALMTFIDHFENVPYTFRVFYELENKVMTTIDSKIYNYKRKEIKLELDKNITKPKNIIFIVSESIRGDFISVNSNDPEIKKATPELEYLQKKGEFKTFGIMYSLGNCSSPSNTFLMNGGRFKNHKIEPTIYQYMKNAGYETYRIDSPHTGYLNGVKRYDNKYIDKYISNEKVTPAYMRDFKSLKDIEKILKNKKNNFIYLTKHGAHFPIEKQYPKEKELFKTESLKENSEERVKKEYLNAINWEINDFFKELEKIINKDTVVIWVSDHGLNIYKDKDKDSVILTHCEHNFNHYRSLFNVAGGIFSKNKKYIKDIKNIKESSAKQILPTILKLVGYKNIEKEYWKPFQEGVIKKEEKRYPLYIPGELGFFNGNDILNEKNQKIEFEDKTYGINKRKDF